MLETAAYTISRLQAAKRGYVGNLEVGYVTPGETLTPEQLEQSRVGKFKPERARPDCGWMPTPAGIQGSCTRQLVMRHPWLLPGPNQRIPRRSGRYRAKGGRLRPLLPQR